MRSIFVVGLCLCLPLSAVAQDKPASTQPASKPSAGLTVAMLDFDADTPDNPRFGDQIGDVLTASLSGANGITLLERSQFSKILAEHQLNLSGLVSTDKAVQIGKLIGASVLVTGKAFAINGNTVVTAKLIGTQTTLVDGVMVKCKQGAEMGELLMELSARLAAKLRESGPRLVEGFEAPADPLPALKARLAGRKLPRIALQIEEEKTTSVRPGEPPVTAEVKKMLLDCGFAVVAAGGATAGPGADIVVKARATSQFSTRVGHLNTYSAAVEVSLVDAASGKILYADRVTARAVDLSDSTAAETALQKAAAQAGQRILEHLDKNLPAASSGPTGR